jgi:hypothetical protein
MAAVEAVEAQLEDIHLQITLMELAATAGLDEPLLTAVAVAAAELSVQAQPQGQ